MDRCNVEPYGRYRLPEMLSSYNLPAYYNMQPPGPIQPEIGNILDTMKRLSYLGYSDAYHLQLHWQHYFYWIMEEKNYQEEQQQRMKEATMMNQNPGTPPQQNQFVCEWPGCLRDFQTEEILQQHRRSHIRKSNYLCQYCSRRLLNREDYQEHVVWCQTVLNHQDNREPIQASTLTTVQQEPPDCKDKAPRPKLSDADRYSLIQQLISSSLDSNQIDDGRRTWTKQDLKSWLSIEASNEPASNRCSRQKSPENDYKRTRYSGIGRYQCPWLGCNYTPHFLRDLRRHVFKHTGYKKYKCPHCQFDSVWKTSLLQHQRKKHGTESSPVFAR